MSAHTLLHNLPDNAIQRLFDNAGKFPDRVALITQDEKTWTYSEFIEAVQKQRAIVRSKNLKKGDCVGILARPTTATLILLSSLVAEGIASVLVDPALSLRQIFWSLKHSQCRCIWGDKDILRMLWLSPGLWSIPRYRIEPIIAQELAVADVPVSMQDEDLVFLSYTSGSTGKPKAVPRNHFTLIHQQHFASQYLPPLLEDIHFCGYTVSALQSLIDGATTILPCTDFKENIRRIEKYHCTRVSGPPGFFMDLCREFEGRSYWPQVQSVLTGGGPISQSFCKKLQALFPQAQIHLIYGSTECEPIAFIRTDQLALSHGRGYCVGQVLPELEVKLFSTAELLKKNCVETSPGEVCITGPSVVKKYFDSDEDEQKLKFKDSEGRIWHRTGDIGEWSSDGNLHLLGRYAYSNENYLNGVVEAELENTVLIQRAAFFYYQDTFRLALELKSETDQLAALELTESILRKHHLSSTPVHVSPKPLPVDRRHRWKIQREKIIHDLF
jgi:olefin beta-lactone synthetase